MLLRILPLLLLAILPVVRAAEPLVVAKVQPQYRPRADSFSLIPPKAGELVQQVPFVAFKREWTYEAPKVTILFLARTRPIRIEATFDYEGKSPAERWNATLKTLFAAFDRDGDGTLNRHEAELIFTLAEMKQMLATGYGFRTPQQGPMPTLEAIDRDGDGRVSFDEFAAYYDKQVNGFLTLNPYPVNVQADTITPEVFARLDADGDGKITAEEFKLAEKLFALLDADEDECISIQEFLANPLKKAGTVALGNPGRAMLIQANGPRPIAPPSDTMVFRGPLPGTVVQQIIKKYDKNDDFELTREEIGFSKADFAKLDTNRNGKITATELDAWREKPADLKVHFSIAAKPADCKATLSLGDGCSDGIVLPKPGTNLVLRVGTQTLDLGTVGPSAQFAQANNQLAFLFPPGKDEIYEKELTTPQFQYLRVMFDAADFNGDGKLTREEMQKYSDLQQSVARLNQSLYSATRVPNLFSLIDANGDGKISMKELRTAYARLLPLEPTDNAKAITKAILQPSAIVRVGVGQSAASDPVFYGNQYAMNQNMPLTKGPVWFRKMDRNGDGELSRTEFLGSAADFDAIDTDGDGYISLDEAEAYDAKTRK
jgi:Ca2+-binding EF-hand superfamily protein